MMEKDQLNEKVRGLKRNQVGFKALSEELSIEITKHYVSESLVSVMKNEETEDTINFTLNELQEVEQSLIDKIQNCSEEHNHPLFRQLVLKYLEEKYKDAPKDDEDDEEDNDKEDKEEDEEDNDDEDEKKDDDDDGSDDDDQGGPAGKESEKHADTEEDSDEEHSPQHVKEVKIKRFNDKRTLQGKKHSSQNLSLSEVLQEGENAMYWKAVAMKQMFSKWQLKTQLAQLNGYMQRTFVKKFGKIEAIKDDYPPAN